VVEEVGENGHITVEARNRLALGESVEFIGRGMASHHYILDEIRGTGDRGDGGSFLQFANPNQRITFQVPFRVEKFDLIRRERTD
jgi:hypothetical protein